MSNAVTVAAIELAGFNDPNATPCQQSIAACDQIATVHIEADDWDVDTCAEHAIAVLREWLDAPERENLYDVESANYRRAEDTPADSDGHRFVPNADGRACARCNGDERSMASRPCPADD